MTTDLPRSLADKLRDLVEKGPANEVEVVFECPVCHDTGFVIGENEDGSTTGRKCRCALPVGESIKPKDVKQSASGDKEIPF